MLDELSHANNKEKKEVLRVCRCGEVPLRTHNEDTSLINQPLMKAASTRILVSNDNWQTPGCSISHKSALWMDQHEFSIKPKVAQLAPLEPCRQHKTRSNFGFSQKREFVPYLQNCA